MSVHAILGASGLFLIWAGLRLWTLNSKRKKGAPPPDKRREALLWVFVFYLLSLYQITVFRYGVNPELWHAWGDSLDSINLTPFVHTIKLYYAYTKWFFYYNLFGNIVWFVPFGALLPAVSKRCGFWMTALLGLCCSFSIEVMQFIFATGISDVDDLIFNTAGAILGYLIYLCIRTIYRAVHKRKKA